MDEPAVGTASLGGQVVPVLRFGALPPHQDAEGDLESMCFLAGQGVGLVQEVTPAAEIVRALMDGAQRIIEERLAPSLVGVSR